MGLGGEIAPRRGTGAPSLRVALRGGTPRVSRSSRDENLYHSRASFGSPCSLILLLGYLLLLASYQTIRSYNFLAFPHPFSPLLALCRPLSHFLAPPRPFSHFLALPRTSSHFLAPPRPSSPSLVTFSPFLTSVPNFSKTLLYSLSL